LQRCGEEGELRAEAMSAERLERAIEIVAVDFGDVAELTGRDLVPIEQRLEEYGSEPPPIGEDLPALDPVDEHRLLGRFMADRARRRGEPAAEVAWLRSELAIEDELAA
jgi:hypothetical protein